MSEHHSIEAQPRTPKVPKGGALRRSGRVPAVYYNAKREMKFLSFNEIELARLLKKEISILDLKLDGKVLPCIIREVQRHPVRGSVVHLDLYGVDRSQKLRARVALHMVGIPEGVKLQGGTVDVIVHEVEVECLPDQLPSHLDVSITHLKIGDVVRLGDLKFEGLSILGDANSAIVHVEGAKAHDETPATAEATAAEPEVIREKKPAEE
jgi:large subunit ribosomal protein L25